MIKGELRRTTECDATLLTVRSAAHVSSVGSREMSACGGS